MRIGWLLLCASGLCAAPVERYGIFEDVYQASGRYGNPYVEVTAEAALTRPGGGVWRIPLFWDGGNAWKLRASPDTTGKWSFKISSNDTGLNGRGGTFECVASRRPGGLRPSAARPGHFERQNGSPVWFLGDTGWGYFSDSPEDRHDRTQAEHYARTRASQGFNAIHAMLLSEQGVGNRGGLPFDDMGAQRLNPAYWKEVDERLAFANRQGLTVGLALAWGDKRKVEPFAWRRFPDFEARRRYARYIAARYSAYDVYFLVSGEWHAEIRTRPGVTEDEVFREFVAIGEALAAADPHDRMAGIHPMSGHGSVREFHSAPWMSFADYQQNYHDLHVRALLSRHLRGPVVNSEYGYLLRDADGDGRPDKDNSYTTEDMRFASWDIAMAGAYLVTGFGTTYFAGHRDPGPFDVDTARNDEWEAQAGHLRRFFGALAWWKLVPADALLSAKEPRGADRPFERGGKPVGVRPPDTAYWALAAPGETYVVYVRGIRAPVTLETGARRLTYRVRRFDPRSGAFHPLPGVQAGSFRFAPPDGRDWVVLLEAARTP
ncbi:MAG: DUF4038 domain-containing protein [Bryobacterales bacterium]|nr:DUF4038 domain-containing protein [Bryobacterales bacterium]